MGLNIIGLASALKGYKDSEQQKTLNAAQARQEQRDQWKFEQEKRVHDQAASLEAFRNGEEPEVRKTPRSGGLFSVPASASQTNSGSTASGAPGPAAPAGQAEPSAAVPQGIKTLGDFQQAEAISSQKPAATNPNKLSDVLQKRLDQYAAAHSADVTGIAQRKKILDEQLAAESSDAHAKFLRKGEPALQLLIASGGMDTSGIDEVSSAYWPDKYHYKTTRNRDGSYTSTQYTVADNGALVPTGATREFKNMDELGLAFTNLLHPDVYATAHQKAQEAGLIEGAKLPSQIELDKEKTTNHIEFANKTGLTDKNGALAEHARQPRPVPRAASAKPYGLTLAQERHNREIVAARTAVSGLTPEVIRHRTSSSTNTGRANPDYDPNLAHQVRLARQRMIGADDFFDRQYQGQSQPEVSGGNPPATRQTPPSAAKAAQSPVMLGGRDIAQYSDDALAKLHGSNMASPDAKVRIDAELTRRSFSNDRAMHGNSLGELTPKGYKVLDASGRHIGYYAR